MRRSRGSKAYRGHQDSQLVKLAGSGDPAALEALYDRYGSAAYSLALRILTEQALAERVVQGVFLSLWRGARRFDSSRGTVGTYLLSMTRHRSVESVRLQKNLRHRPEPREVLAVDTDPPAGIDQDLEASEEASERRSRVRAALAAQPEPQRDALLLAYFGGYTQREIASLLGVPLETVKTRMAAGMRRLKEDFREAGRQEQFPWIRR